MNDKTKERYELAITTKINTDLDLQVLELDQTNKTSSRTSTRSEVDYLCFGNKKTAANKQQQ